MMIPCHAWTLATHQQPCNGAREEFAIPWSLGELSLMGSYGASCSSGALQGPEILAWLCRECERKVKTGGLPIFVFTQNASANNATTSQTFQSHLPRGILGKKNAGFQEHYYSKISNGRDKRAIGKKAGTNFPGTHHPPKFKLDILPENSWFSSNYHTFPSRVPLLQNSSTHQK